MPESGIETILNNTGSFGQLNAVLYFKEPSSHFKLIFDDLIDVFGPEKIAYSLFDLDSDEMIEIQIITFPIQNENAIIQAILIKKREKIFLEYYRDQFIIEHVFRPNDIEHVGGYNLIDKYRQEKSGYILAIGFELSIHLSSYNSSLQENLSDASLHPILLVKDENDALTEIYNAYDCELNDCKIEILQRYCQCIKY